MLNTKTTNTYKYFHCRSPHPKNLKDNLPYSLAIRLRRIYTEINELKRQNDKFKQKFSARRYSHMLIENQIMKAISTSRQGILNVKLKVEMNYTSS